MNVIFASIFSAFYFIFMLESLAQIQFPGKFELPKPVACSDESPFCGDDPQKYPKEEIDKIVLKSIELQIAPETSERFFGASDASSESSQPYSDSLRPSCETRVEVIPRYARAKNVFGTWVYLVEAAEHLRQNVKIILCEKTDVPCKNDIDSPHGEDTTSCKQIYQTQKLLAVNRNGEIVVDTFKLPSACSCQYKGRFGLNFRNAFESTSPTKDPPKCTADNATQSLDELNIPLQEQNALPLQLGNSTSDIKPCKSGDVLCESDDESEHPDDSYPETLIENMLETHVVFKSPTFFGAIFGEICEPQDNNTTLTVRGGFDIELSDLCSSHQKYIYPKKAKNVNGEWHYVINTNQYRQGVTIEVCLPRVKESPCKYGGSEGINPDSTICKQLYSVHHMLAVKTNGTVTYEPFSIPSSCSCYIQDDSFFES